jgi:hypothetical protein
MSLIPRCLVVNAISLWERCLPAIRTLRSEVNRIQPYRRNAAQTKHRPQGSGFQVAIQFVCWDCSYDAL